MLTRPLSYVPSSVVPSSVVRPCPPPYPSPPATSLTPPSHTQSPHFIPYATPPHIHTRTSIWELGLEGSQQVGVASRRTERRCTCLCPQRQLGREGPCRRPATGRSSTASRADGTGTTTIGQAGPPPSGKVTQAALRLAGLVRRRVCAIDGHHISQRCFVLPRALERLGAMTQRLAAVGIELQCSGVLLDSLLQPAMIQSYAQ